MILVTGGTGFIGSNIVAALVARGDRVAVCDRHLDDGRASHIAGLAVEQWVAAEDVVAWLAGRVDVTAVVHMGAISATTETDVDLVLRTNVWLSLELWDLCAARGIPFIYASSAQVYGDGALGFADDESQQAMARLRTITPYGASKLLFDRLVIRERDAGRPLPPQWAGLRFFNVYGPHEGHKGGMMSVIAKTYPALAAGRSACSARNGRTIRTAARSAISSMSPIAPMSCSGCSITRGSAASSTWAAARPAPGSTLPTPCLPPWAANLASSSSTCPPNCAVATSISPRPT